MAEKKDLYKFTIQFNPADPTHRQTADILNQQGRRKAQFLVNAVMHYMHCSETPDAAPPVFDTALIETVVRRILEEQGKTSSDSEPETLLKAPDKPAETLRLEDASDMLGAEGLAAIANTMAMFRQNGG